jgi:hypothetical protein
MLGAATVGGIPGLCARIRLPFGGIRSTRVQIRGVEVGQLRRKWCWWCAPAVHRRRRGKPAGGAAGTGSWCRARVRMEHGRVIGGRGRGRLPHLDPTASRLDLRVPPPSSGFKAPCVFVLDVGKHRRKPRWICRQDDGDAFGRRFPPWRRRDGVFPLRPAAGRAGCAVVAWLAATCLDKC